MSHYRYGTEFGFEWLPAVIDSLEKANQDTTFKQGVYTENGQEFIELSFSKLDRHTLTNVRPDNSDASDDLQFYYMPTPFGYARNNLSLIHIPEPTRPY